MVQNAPEKAIITPPSPNFNITVNPPANRLELTSQVVANVECNAPPPQCLFNEGNNFVQSSCSMKEEPGKDVKMYIENDLTSVSSLQKSDSLQSDSNNVSSTQNNENRSIGDNSCDALELNIQEILALDIEYCSRNSKGSFLGQSSKSSEKIKSKSVFKSLPNLSASSENLLV